MFAPRLRRTHGTGRMLPVASRVVLAPVMAAALITLAACGATTPTARHSHGHPAAARSHPAAAAGHRAPGGTGLCSATTELDSLTVTRTDAFPQNHIRFTFPAEVTVSDPVSARAVARALCTLRGPGAPTAHSAAIACPINLGVTYQLSFAAPARRFAPVSIGATGCELIRGLATTRWARGSTLLWRTLGTAMHLPDPGNAVFRGSAPSPARN